MKSKKLRREPDEVIAQHNGFHPWTDVHGERHTDDHCQQLMKR